MFRIGFPNGLAGKQSACNARGTGKVSSIPGLGRSPWKRKWQPTLVFLPGKSHEQRSLMGYSLWGQKELEVTERVTLSLHFFHIIIYVDSLCNNFHWGIFYVKHDLLSRAGANT